MQRDTHLTFEDILDSDDPKVLRQAIDAIPLLSKNEDALRVPQDLRFIQVPDEVFQNGYSGNATCKLGRVKDADENLVYIAVSYCWDSYGGYQSSTALEDGTTRIEDKSHLRTPKCPNEVLRRAIEYACKKQLKYIWIDQECIEQADPVDLQRHLQCMHLVFDKAVWTIGVLSLKIVNPRQQNTLKRVTDIIAATREHDFNLDGSNHNQAPPEMLDNNFVSFLTRLLKTMALDLWYTRTWVLQERTKAGDSARVLLRSSPPWEHLADVDKRHHADIELDPVDPLRFAILCQQLRQDSGSETNSSMRQALDDLRCAAAPIADPAFTATEGFATHSKGLKSAVWDVKNWSINPIDAPFDGYEPRLYFSAIEQSSNRIVSDRVAVLANMMELKHILDTSAQQSYNIAVLTLLSMNKFLPRILVQCNDASQFETGAMRRISEERLHKGLQDAKRFVTVYPDCQSPSLLRDMQAITGFLSHGKLRQIAGKPECSDQLPSSGGPISAEHTAESSSFYALEVVPTNVTTNDLLEGVSNRAHRSSYSLSQGDGCRIVDYAVVHGMIPLDSTFIGFWGGFCYKPDFINRYFTTVDAAESDSK